MMRPLDEMERRTLLEALARLPVDAESETQNLQGFLPLREHARALHPSVLVVRGARGAGKSALFKAVGATREQRLPLKALFPNLEEEALEWVEGFSEIGSLHAPVGVLQDLAATSGDPDLRRFWLGHLVGRLWHELQPSMPCPLPAWEGQGTAPSRWLETVVACQESLFQWLDALDNWADSQGRWICVSYDHLDRISPGSDGIRDRYISALLGLWMSLANRTRRIRCKVFLRDDLFRGLRNLPDASKLESRSVSLDWTVDNLFRLLVRRMAADSTLHSWLTIHRVVLEARRDLGWMPGAVMGEEERKSLMACLAPENMGVGPKKGATYRWIPNHLQDAKGAIVPRSLLNLIKAAAEEALIRGHASPYLLAPIHLSMGLIKASSLRFQEVQEEHREVKRLEAFRNQTAPFAAGAFLRDLGAAPAEDEHGRDGKRVLDTLLGLGLLSERVDGRLDVPDIYRFGLSIKRKGGVKQPG